MFERAALLYLYVETPLHAGSGTSLGIVDLPIQRERITGYPMVQGSGLKGCLRDMVPKSEDQKAKIVFGPKTTGASDHAGALSVGDARLLLFPVRSLIGIFAWVTSEGVLARFRRDAEMAGTQVGWQITGPKDNNQALIASGDIARSGRIVLEEFAFEAKEDPEVRKIAQWLKDNALPSGDEYTYWHTALLKRLAILPEDAFRDFTRFSTEVISRTRLSDETKTVESGALWSEEHLPSETLLYAPLFASKPRVDNPPDDLKDADAILRFVKTHADGKRLQLGGDATVGRGFVKVRI